MARAQLNGHGAWQTDVEWGAYRCTGPHDQYNQPGVKDFTCLAACSVDAELPLPEGVRDVGQLKVLVVSQQQRGVQESVVELWHSEDLQAAWVEALQAVAIVRSAP